MVLACARNGTLLGKQERQRKRKYHRSTYTASSASLVLLAAVLIPKIHPQQSFLSIHRTEGKLFPCIWQDLFLLSYNSRLRTQHTKKHGTLQTRINRRQRLLQIKNTAKNDSCVALLLVVSAGDITRGYYPEQNTQFSSTPIQGVTNVNPICTTLLCSSVLYHTYDHKKARGTYTAAVPLPV